jgi:hypothetical protein
MARAKDIIAPAAATSAASNCRGIKSGSNPYANPAIVGNMIVNQVGVCTHIANIEPSRKNKLMVTSPEIIPAFQPDPTQPMVRLIT